MPHLTGSVNRAGSTGGGGFWPTLPYRCGRCSVILIFGFGRMDVAVRLVQLPMVELVDRFEGRVHQHFEGSLWFTAVGGLGCPWRSVSWLRVTKGRLTVRLASVRVRVAYSPA